MKERVCMSQAPRVGNSAAGTAAGRVRVCTIPMGET
eukprot:CAMPEP_0196659708 /NCGR_PEP_ID=MMETSP1086-20130531/36339_1 /TAXON_ID=77921 /ORGANISM="Cyanoptyche  gloeocystis , Strain SAG4.97" /LENGTH=35 /DNA_ID= /DNA_START= /DNA_END= /DNA_ORIENTATION=